MVIALNQSYYKTTKKNTYKHAVLICNNNYDIMLMYHFFLKNSLTSLMGYSSKNPYPYKLVRYCLHLKIRKYCIKRIQSLCVLKPTDI